MAVISPYLAYNAVGWVLGGVSLLIFGYQIYRIDRSLSTQLTRHYITYCLALGIGILVFSVPALLTADPHILKSFYNVGEAIVDFSLVYQAWVAAHFLIGSNLAKRIATTLTALVAAFLWVEQVLSPDPYRFDNSVVWPMNSLAHYGITAIMAILLVPVTLFFLRQAFLGTETASRIKSFATGMTCGVIFVQYMILLYYYHDHQPFWASIINIIAFSVFLVALLIPRKLTATVIGSQLPNGTNVSASKGESGV